MTCKRPASKKYSLSMLRPLYSKLRYCSSVWQTLKVKPLVFPIYLCTSGGTHRTPPGLAECSLHPAAVLIRRQRETRQRTPGASQSRAAPSALGRQHRQGPAVEGWGNWQPRHCPFWRSRVHVNERRCWKQQSIRMRCNVTALKTPLTFDTKRGHSRSYAEETKTPLCYTSYINTLWWEWKVEYVGFESM